LHSAIYKEEYPENPETSAEANEKQTVCKF